MAAEYDLAIVRNLLDDALNAGDVRILAFDLFQPVYNNFAAGMNKEQMIEAIVDYANRQGRISDLLYYVKQKNPYRYDLYVGQLKSVPHATNREPRTVSSYLEQLLYDIQRLGQVDESVAEYWSGEEPLSEEYRPEYQEYDDDYPESDKGEFFKTLLAIVAVIVVGYVIYRVFFAGKLTIRAISVDPIAPVLYAATNKGVLKINTETTSVEGFIIPPQASLQNSRAILVVDNGSFSSFYADYNGQIY